MLPGFERLLDSLREDGHAPIPGTLGVEPVYTKMYYSDRKRPKVIVWPNRRCQHCSREFNVLHRERVLTFEDANRPLGQGEDGRVHVVCLDRERCRAKSGPAKGHVVMQKDKVAQATGMASLDALIESLRRDGFRALPETVYLFRARNAKDGCHMCGQKFTDPHEHVLSFQDADNEYNRYYGPEPTVVCCDRRTCRDRRAARREKRERRVLAEVRLPVVS